MGQTFSTTNTRIIKPEIDKFIKKYSESEFLKLESAVKKYVPSERQKQWVDEFTRMKGVDEEYNCAGALKYYLFAINVKFITPENGFNRPKPLNEGKFNETVYEYHCRVADYIDLMSILMVTKLNFLNGLQNVDLNQKLKGDVFSAYITIWNLRKGHRCMKLIQTFYQ